MDDLPVRLRPMRHGDVETVVATATAGTRPADVMPPDDDPDPDGWSERRAAGLAAFLRSRLARLPDGRQEISYVVEVDDRVAGVARLLPRADGTAMEAGLWLTRDVRGRGVGRRVLGLLADEARARGGEELVADTTTDNVAAVALLHRLGARPTASGRSSHAVSARLILRGR
jgi:RimJ/RimL family protein N-acetyltransferase